MDQSSDDRALDNALDFVAGRQHSASRLHATDEDLFSWMMMHGDLFPPSEPSLALTPSLHPALTPSLLPSVPEDGNSMHHSPSRLVDHTRLSPTMFFSPNERHMDVGDDVLVPAAARDDGLFSVAMHRASDLRNNAQAALKSGWNKLAATLGFQPSMTGEYFDGGEGGPMPAEPPYEMGGPGGTASSSGLAPRAASSASRSTASSGAAKTDLASLLQAEGDPFSVEAMRNPKRRTRRQAGLETPAASVPAGKRRRGGEGDEQLEAGDNGTGGAGRGAGGSSDRPAVGRGVRQSELQRRVSALEAENEQLKAQLRALNMAQGPDEAGFEEQRKAQLHQIEAMVASGASESKLRQAIVQYKDIHSDFGNDRWTALKHHLRCLKKLMLPTQVTKMAMWSVGQDSTEQTGSSSSGSGSGGGVPEVASPPASRSVSSIWESMAAAIELSPDQQKRILTLRDSVRARRSEFAELLTLLKRLEDNIGSNFHALEFQMNLLMSHVSPRQIALFMQWIENNQPLLAIPASLNSWPQAKPGSTEEGGGRRSASESSTSRGASAGASAGAGATSAAHRRQIDPIASATALRGRKRRMDSIDESPQTGRGAPPPAPLPLGVSGAPIPTSASTMAAVVADGSSGMPTPSFGSQFSLPSIGIPAILSQGFNTMSNALPSLGFRGAARESGSSNPAHKA